MSIPQIFRALIDQSIENAPEFQEKAQAFSQSLHQAILKRGEAARSAADVLHGKSIGHPLHPILTDITLGSWALGTLFDFLALVTFSTTLRRTATRLITIGTVSALPTALAGMTDYSAIEQAAAGHSAVHGGLNATAWFLYVRSLRARGHHRDLRAFLYAAAGLCIATAAAWMGGDLVYRQRIGVNHAPVARDDDEWIPVLAESTLLNAEPQRVDAGGQPILLYREGRTIDAVGAVCSHAGGPLEEGTFEAGCVQCPWHDSVFDLRDGHVVHGPATFDLPRYETRIRDGQIEIRRWRPEKSQAPPQDQAAANGRPRQKKARVDLVHETSTRQSE